jgi:hypothetical protein
MATIAGITADTLNGAILAPGPVATAVHKQGQDGEILVQGPTYGRRGTLISRHIVASKSAANALHATAVATIGTQTSYSTGANGSNINVLGVRLVEQKAVVSGGTAKVRVVFEWSVISRA